jgi:hypothetical protein
MNVRPNYVGSTLRKERKIECKQSEGCALSNLVRGKFGSNPTRLE